MNPQVKETIIVLKAERGRIDAAITALEGLNSHSATQAIGAAAISAFHVPVRGVPKKHFTAHGTVVCQYKDCPRQGKPFKAKKPGARKYCSNACRFMVNNLKRKAERGEPKVFAHCAKCERKFKMEKGFTKVCPDCRSKINTANAAERRHAYLAHMGEVPKNKPVTLIPGDSLKA